MCVWGSIRLCVYELCTFGTCAHVNGVLHAIMNLRKPEEDINCIGLSVSDLFLCPFKICYFLNLKLGWQPTSLRHTSFFFSFSAGIVSSQMHIWPYPVFMWKPNSAFMSSVAKFLTTEPYFSQMVMTYDVFVGTCTQDLSKTDNAFNHRVMSLS